MPIYKKLLDFQKLDIKIEKDGINPFFKSEYTTLNEVLGKVKAPLNKLGILIIQIPTFNGLTTVLIDTEDDSKVECYMPYVGHTNAQQLGAANTYNRRYSLITLLGLEDDDDDGNSAVSKPVSKAEAGRQKTEKEFQKNKSDKENGVPPFSDSNGRDFDL